MVEEPDKAFSRSLSNIRGQHDLWPHLSRAMQHADRGEYQEVIRCCTEQLVVEPTNSHALALRGQAHYWLRRFYKTIEDCSLALKHNRESVPARLWRGLARIRIGDCQLATEDHNVDVVVNCDFGWIAQERGSAFASRGAYASSLPELERAIRLKHRLPSSLFIRGSVFLAMGRYIDSLEDYSKALQHSPKYHDLFAYRGLAASKVGDGHSALSDCTLAISRNPSSQNYAIRSIVLTTIGDYSNAMLDKERSLRIDPKWQFLDKLSWFVMPSDLFPDLRGEIEMITKK